MDSRGYQTVDVAVAANDYDHANDHAGGREMNYDRSSSSSGEHSRISSQPSLL